MCDTLWCNFYLYVVGSFEGTGWYLVSAGILIIGYSLGRRYQ
jgi:hypothetical protein